MALPAFAVTTFTYTYEGNTLRYYIIDETTKSCRVAADRSTFSSSEDIELVIPSVAMDGDKAYTVVELGDECFADCTNLVSVSIPNTVTIIPAGIFYRCSRLESVIIPNSITTIGYDAFYECISLSSITLPNSVTSIGSYAFYNCIKLTSIDIPRSVTAINKSTFEGCTSLESVVIPSSVTSIGFHSFYRSGLTSLTIQSSAVTIENCAFFDCNELSSINISCQQAPEIEEQVFSSHAYQNAVLNVPAKSFASYFCTNWWNFNNLLIGGVAPETEKYSDGVFTYLIIINTDYKEAVLIGGNYSLMEQINIPERFSYDKNTTQPIRYYITGIGAKAFEACTKITDLLFSPHSAITTIGVDAFNGCKKLQSITIPNAVRSIGKNAFRDCSALSTATVGYSVTSIGSYAFSGCSGLKDLTFLDGSETIEIAEGAFSKVAPEKLYLGRTVSTRFLSDYTALTDLTIGNTITEINAKAWENCTTLSALNLGSSLTSIGDKAFSGCRSLTEVVVPPSVETIGASAFDGDTKLSSIIMGHSVATIGDKAFNGCPASTVSITAPTPPTAPNNTFSNYTGKLYLPNQAAINAYYDAYTCWDRFYSYAMIEPTSLVTDETTIDGKSGDSVQLTATLQPADVTLPQIFWRSTDPEVATVDHNGVMTIVSEYVDQECTIVAETLYANGPVAEVKVRTTEGKSGIDEVISEPVADDATFEDAPEVIYNLSGIRMSATVDNLPAGIYIVRQGSRVRKIAVR